MLKTAGIEDGIMHKSWGGGPKLTDWQRARNRHIASIRCRVETVFAIFKKHMGYRRVRYIGLIKNQA
jgi:IS5 family transposase